MMIVLFLMLMPRFGRCTDDQILETKAVVGDDVKLACNRKLVGSLFWIRLVSGNLPKILGRTFSYEADARITVKKKPGLFVLHIKDARLSDSAVYYCMKTLNTQQKIIFLRGTNLRVEEPEADPRLEPDISAVPPLVPPDPVCSGDSVTLRCSVLLDSENQCPEEHRVCCFRAASHQYHQSVNSQGNGVEKRGENPEGLKTKNCMYSFSQNASSSDTRTYCAEATCEEIFTGHRSNLDTDVNMLDLRKNDTILFLLCAALAVSLIGIAFLIHTTKKLKKRSCGVCRDAVVLQTTAGGHQQSLQADEDSLVYSAAIFSQRKAGNRGTRDERTEEEECIYTDVRALGSV